MGSCNHLTNVETLFVSVSEAAQRRIQRQLAREDANAAGTPAPPIAPDDDVSEAEEDEENFAESSSGEETPDEAEDDMGDAAGGDDGETSIVSSSDNYRPVRQHGQDAFLPGSDLWLGVPLLQSTFIAPTDDPSSTSSEPSAAQGEVGGATSSMLGTSLMDGSSELWTLPPALVPGQRTPFTEWGPGHLASVTQNQPSSSGAGECETVQTLIRVVKQRKLIACFCLRLT